MLAIRYFRIGKKNQPYFKIVVTDKRRPTRGGRFVEEVGFSDPVKKKRILKADRIKYWISKGAQPSDSIHNLLISEKIIEGKKIDVHSKKKVKEGQTPAAAPVATAPTPKPLEIPNPAETPKEEPKIGPPVEQLKVEAPIKEKRIDAPKEPFDAAQGKEPKIDVSAEALAKAEAPAEEKKIEPPVEEKKIEPPKEPSSAEATAGKEKK